MAEPNNAASLASLPAGKPPPGVQQNLTDPSTEGPVLIGVGGAFTLLALLFVTARIYTKVKIIGKWTPDDSKLSLVRYLHSLIVAATCIVGAVCIVV